ncbi:RNA polymerase sigma factor [Enhygromyxa salina]|uniref:ECF RNA polymerase sigma factor SigE n=1 Tax=Enhygromyxa salina TaxID=215803 RepID=A0A2S9YVJ2_9BACT|nr:sigma-70 family RNA polymerase sigma factor [Enhygromyxa salina]PRQ09106.1 ECF RNA polymerase sigma factor SigE [Enhygromyxa salina]
MGSATRSADAEFAAAYRAHVDFVWRVLARRGVDPSALEDATQEVFVVAHRQWGAWDDRATMRAWLYGVARRVASTHHRGQRRRQRKLASLVPPEPQDLEARIEGRARLVALAQAIDSLDPVYREIFVLADIDQLTAPAIAEALGCNLNTVYTRLRRARAHVTRAMTARELDEPNQERQHAKSR